MGLEGVNTSVMLKQSCWAAQGAAGNANLERGGG